MTWQNDARLFRELRIKMGREWRIAEIGERSVVCVSESDQQRVLFQLTQEKPWETYFFSTQKRIVVILSHFNAEILRHLLVHLDCAVVPIVFEYHF